MFEGSPRSNAGILPITSQVSGESAIHGGFAGNLEI
jgi:hypothetical protein